ncbi:MAG TPA: hypothetical protein VJ023_01730 [Pyrinomonadaceae bacterium]|nr:hypothetical protein [Pyrinomonadaceae bacterium]
MPIPIADCQLFYRTIQSAIGNLFRFLMSGVLAATATKLTELKPVGRGFLVFGRDVVAALTLVTLKNNIIAWHILPT